MVNFYGQWKPVIAMIGVNLALAIVNVLLKLTLDKGVHNLVVVTYRQSVSCVFLTPIAFFCESEIQALGFDDKFIRTWEYYFDYCAAGFNACTLGNYQIVFSRPGNVALLNDPYKGFPSAY